MQTEFLNRRRRNTRLEMGTAMLYRIEAFYNRRRRYSSLGYLSPNGFEHQAAWAATNRDQHQKHTPPWTNLKGHLSAANNQRLLSR